MSPTQVAPDGSIQEVPGYGASAPASLDEIVERNAVKRERDEAKQALAEAERAERMRPWLDEYNRISALVRRSAAQLQAIEAKVEADPLNIALAGDAIAAERILVRQQLRLDDHKAEEPA
jgi:hypothetical protein